MDVATVLSASAALITAICALIVQLRKFRREIVQAVELHMRLTAENQKLLRQISDDHNGQCRYSA